MSGRRVRRRLTTWYALVTLALLLMALLAMRHFARRALFEEHESAVARSAALVRSFFRAELAEYRAIDVTISHLAGELVFAGMGIAFVRPDGTTFATARQPLAAAQPRPPIVERTAPLDHELAPGWRLHLTISTAGLSEARQDIDRITILALPIAAILAALVGWWMTGRALAPVSRMATAADRLQTGGGGRLPVINTDDEFGRLGLAFNGVLARLDAALDNQRRFLADAAHELRTPVARLSGMADARLAQPGAGEDRSTLEEMRRELQRTARVIDELLYLARSDSGALVAEPREIFLDDIASDVVSRLGPLAGARGLTIDVGALEEAPAHADPALVSRLVAALVDNAIRYTPQGGRLRVATALDGDRSIISVEDSGPGIPPEERNQVFSRFFRGQEARQVAPEGTGLGLAIARAIMETHGGTLSIGESPLGGASLVARFPRS